MHFLELKGRFMDENVARDVINVHMVVTQVSRRLPMPTTALGVMELCARHTIGAMACCSHMTN